MSGLYIFVAGGAPVYAPRGVLMCRATVRSTDTSHAAPPAPAWACNGGPPVWP